MQTFLPYNSFTETAQCLDYKRLGKQRVECKQLLTALDNKRRGIASGWQNHPATLMWEGYEMALCTYATAICQEWKRRKYKDSLLTWFLDQQIIWSRISGVRPPPWLGDERLHASHRGRLLFKDPVYYGKFDWNELPRSDKEGYYWPVTKNKTCILFQ